MILLTDPASRPHPRRGTGRAVDTRPLDAPTGQQTRPVFREANCTRQEQQVRRTAVKERVRAEFRKRRTAGISKIHPRADARVDLEAEGGKRLNCLGANAVTTGLVDCRSHGERTLNLVSQVFDLGQFQRDIKVERKAVSGVELFLERRIDPWMQMGANRAATVGENRQQRLVPSRLMGHTVVDDVGGFDLIAVENVLSATDVPHGSDIDVVARKRRRPVEFFLGVDHGKQEGTLRSITFDPRFRPPKGVTRKAHTSRSSYSLQHGRPSPPFKASSAPLTTA